MAIIDWPSNLKPINVATPYLAMQGATAGPSITGQERFVRNPAERWHYRFSFKMWSRDEHLAWRGLLAMSTGRVGLIRVPICDCAYGVSSNAGSPSAINTNIPHSDGTIHSDGTGYAQGGLEASIAAGAAEGATSFSALMSETKVPWPGQFFSDGDRLYQITDIIPSVAANTYTIKFQPRLRRAIGFNGKVYFDRLWCVMRLASEDHMDVSRELLKFSQHEVSFVEAIV